MANKEVLIFAQLFLATAIGGALIQRPLNVATSVGGQTVFNCSSDTTGALTWLYTTNCNTAGGDVLTDSSCNIISSYSSHYRTEKPGGFVCNLMVFDAMLSLGGCYACADGFGTGRQYQAMLIVVDSNAIITPNSTDLMPGEDVMISSSVSYRGPSIPLQPPPLPPSFYWTLQSNPNQNITSYPGLTSNTSASSYIIVTAQPPNVPPYICSLFFNAPVVVPTSGATNAPTYGTSWETTTYIVSYAPENVQVSGQPDPCLAEPVELMCSASGYPTPTCKWYNFTSGVMLAETCTITIESGGSYQCIASNTIRDTIYNSSSTAVNVIDCKIYVYPQSLICDQPENINISEIMMSCPYDESVVLTCSASGYPIPTYKWSDLTNGGDPYEGSTVKIDRGGTYQCVASNTIRGEIYSQSMNVNISDCFTYVIEDI